MGYNSSCLDETDNITDELNYLLNKKSNSRSKSCTTNKTSSVGVSELRIDILKMLEMMNTLNQEVCALRKKVCALESGACINESTTECHNNNTTSCSINSVSESFHENVDRILSMKLDEFSVKVDQKLKEFDKFMIGTRNIATRRI